MQRRRRLGWTVAALVLFAAAAWLMTRGEEPARTDDPPARVEFPRGLRQAEVERMQSRRTLPAPAATGGDEDPEQPREAAPRDPFLAALPPGGKGRTAVVVEANALTNSPIGQLLLDCLRNRAGHEDPLEALRKQTNIDAAQQLDRVAISDELMLVSGHFAGARWDELLGSASSRRYGERATIYFPGSADGTDGEKALALWDGQIVMFGDDAKVLEQAIDRLEGRAEPGEPAIPEGSTYGEIYGVLAAKELAELFPEGDEELAQRLSEAAEGAELHIDTRGDVAISAKVWGEQPEAVDELARSMGAALALARLKAKAEGEDDLVELLDLARVSPDGEGFGLEVALPMALLEKRLAFCREPRTAEGPEEQSLPTTAEDDRD